MPPPASQRPLSARPKSAAGSGSAVVLVAMAAVLGLMMGGTASATTATPRVAPTTAPTVPVMIVLDASGSMNQTDAPGPRIDAAKAAVTSLINTLPAQTQVGLQVYGTGTGSTDAEKTVGCTDITTLAPVGPLNPDTLTSQIATVVAAGYTPIGNALRAAADALPNEGPRSIVLVSDGQDTCAPPEPCEIAGELAQQGVDLTIHTVGFKVDPTAREQLSCIAQATGGTYSDATDATALTQALATKVDYAITGYTTAGTPVTGADQPTTQAPLLTPGQYIDTFAIGGTDGVDAAGTTKYYAIPVKDDVTPYISATVIPPTDDPQQGEAGVLGIDLTLLAKDLTKCGHNRGFVIASQERREPVTALLGGRPFGSSSFGPRCRSNGVLIVQVERIGEAWTNQPLPIELVIRMEPPADASALPPAAEKGPVLAAPVHGDASAVEGGNSFNDAPELASGVTYSDTLVTGENRFYRIPLTWGQRFSYLITPSRPAEPVLPRPAVTWVDVFNPVRGGVDMTAFTTQGALWFVERAPEPFTASTVYPVRYTNRDSASPRPFSLDGDYYLRLNANVRPADQASSVPFQITVLVSGEVEPGPTYRTGGVGTTPPAQQSPADAMTTSTSSAPTSIDGLVGTTDLGLMATAPTNTASGSLSTGSAVPGWVWAMAAVLVVGVVVALLLVGSRRRSPGSTVAGAVDGSGFNQNGDLRRGAVAALLLVRSRQRSTPSRVRDRNDQPGERH